MSLGIMCRIDSLRCQLRKDEHFRYLLMMFSTDALGFIKNKRCLPNSVWDWIEELNE